MLPIVSLNTTTEQNLWNSIFHLLTHFHHSHETDHSSNVSSYLSCLLNLLSSRESIDDVIWARVHKDLRTTPLRALLHLVSRHQSIDIYSLSLQLASILVKLSSFLSPFVRELFIWLYTWLKGQTNIDIEQFLAQILERTILNPYPLVERQTSSSNSLLTVACRDVAASDDYLNLVLMQISLFGEQIVDIHGETMRRSVLFDGERDFYQIELNIKLNLYEKSVAVNVDEICENLNFLSTTNGEFVRVFDDVLEQVDETNVIVEIVRCLKPIDQVRESNLLRNSKKLFEMIPPNDEKFVRFCWHYLSLDYRVELLMHARDCYEILVEEIERNDNVRQEIFVDMLLEFDEPMQLRTIEAILLLIRRTNDGAENVLKLKQKKIWKLTKVDYDETTMNQRVAELIVK